MRGSVPRACASIELTVSGDGDEERRIGKCQFPARKPPAVRFSALLCVFPYPEPRAALTPVLPLSRRFSQISPITSPVTSPVSSLDGGEIGLTPPLGFVMVPPRP